MGGLPSDGYLLSGGAAELERLRLQAQVWEPEAEALLDAIGIRPGWACLDVGCGAMGILGPLSRRVGTTGRVVGVDMDAKQLAAARAYVAQEGLSNTEVLERDAADTRLPRDSFDFVHARFLLAPAGHEANFLREMLAVLRPGGILAIEEPDTSTWSLYPCSPAWDRLTDMIREAFRLGGGDFDAGRRTFGSLRRAGLEDVRLRAAIVALHENHPYMRLPILFVASLRSRILDGERVTAGELDDLLASCEEDVRNPDAFALSFVVTQVWGRKPVPLVDSSTAGAR